MIHLYMDDLRRCPIGFVLVRTGQECLQILREMEVDILSLDYDMGPEEMTGSEVAAAMVVEGLFAKEIFLHTSSLYGRNSMYEILYSGKPEGCILHNCPVPFSRLDEIEAEYNQKHRNGNK